MRRELKVAAAVLSALAIWNGVAHAQNAGPRRIYTNKPKFRLPLQVDERERERLRLIQLYVKAQGSPQWMMVDSIAPNQKEFVYHAPRDGEYWFTLVTVDSAGRSSPANVSAEPPGLIVVVDREAPEISVQPVALGAGQSCLQCDVRDANPDPSRTKLEYYSTSERCWQPLEAMPEQPGCFRVTDASALRGLVRVTSADRAGNVVVRELNLSSNMASNTGTVNQVQPVALETQPPQMEPRGVPAPSDIKTLQMEPRAVPLPPDTTALPLQSDVRVEKMATPPTLHGNKSRHFLNTTQATLRYEIEKLGPSGVGKVEVWITRDEGMNWQRLCDDPGKSPAIPITLPGEGSFGVTVVAANGNGLGGEPPARGDGPAWRLEVDTVKPTAQITSTRAGTGSDAGTLMINWTANDKNLRPDPIDLWYSNRPEGPWTPIAKGLRNDGSYPWLLPRDLSDELYIRLEVTDLAGNVTAVQAPLDRTRLKANVIGVVPSNADR